MGTIDDLLRQDGTHISNPAHYAIRVLDRIVSAVDDATPTLRADGTMTPRLLHSDITLAVSLALTLVRLAQAQQHARDHKTPSDPLEALARLCRDNPAWPPPHVRDVS